MSTAQHLLQHNPGLKERLSLSSGIVLGLLEPLHIVLLFLVEKKIIEGSYLVLALLKLYSIFFLLFFLSILSNLSFRKATITQRASMASCAIFKNYFVKYLGESSKLFKCLNIFE